MGLLVDSSTSLVQPSITSLSTIETGMNSMGANDNTIVNLAQGSEASTDLLVDENDSQTDKVGQYSSKPRTLTLETGSESILSSSATADINNNSGSLESSENLASPVNVKLYSLIGSFMVVSFVIGSM